MAVSANYWPTEEQELLLKAALLPGQAGLVAWRRVEETIDLQRLDAASQALLPLVYRNAATLHISGPRLGLLKSHYLATWRHNAQLLHRVRRMVTALERDGVSAIVLKGLALSAQYYRDLGVRPMADADVLVPAPMVERASAILCELGWEPWYRLSPGFLRVKHAAGYGDPGGFRCDLHWRVFEEPGPSGADDEFRAAATSVLFEGAAFHILAPTDQLLHVCGHAARWAPVPGIRWVADAIVILRGGAIDWNRLTEHTLRRRFVLRMRHMLYYIQRVMEVEIPPRILAGLAAQPVSILERLEYRIRGREHRLLGELPAYLFNCFRGERHPLLALPRYLQHAWDLESARQVPPHLVGRAVRRVRTALGAQVDEKPLGER
ncbi:MAG TPA: nucleotidyltransferase family protein [Candidatus Methylomirabilis sp.]|nr:nucleotidyltransferase family protein [Candidatus Methylomirabilis sp.]